MVERELQTYEACLWCERAIAAPERACSEADEVSRRALSASPAADPVCKAELKQRGY